MKIISYNVNGIRAAIRKGFLDWLAIADPDVICLQEIKANKDQFDLKAFESAGYLYHYWFSAQKKGYSGVAILCKNEPKKVTFGTGIESMDYEGRNLLVDFPSVSIMSLYLPSGTNIKRLEHKFEYMDLFKNYIDILKKDRPNLVICGDYNICHQAIDIHDPIRNKNVSGFLPHEREWMSKFLNDGFVDAFRMLNKETSKYSWWSYRANSRANNKGWRLDYTLVSNSLKNSIVRANILNEAMHSDHCPVLLELKIKN